MKLSNQSMEAWAWVLIYAGLLLVMLGFFLQWEGGNGAWLQGAGGLLVLPGVLMIVMRARRPDDKQ